MEAETRAFLDLLTAEQREKLQGVFDSDVHDQASFDASAVNNEGLDAQIEYLESCPSNGCEGWVDRMKEELGIDEEGDDAQQDSGHA